MRDVIRHANSSGLDLNPSLYDSQKEACPSYHIKGLCSVRCGWVGEPHPYLTGGDHALMEWDQLSIPGRRMDGDGGELFLHSGTDHGSIGHVIGGGGAYRRRRPLHEKRDGNPGGGL